MRRGKLSIYYVPFEWVNPTARIMIIGLTPGRQQMALACRAAGTALRDGRPVAEALESAKTVAGSAGTMRDNLVGMLDKIGTHDWLGLSTTRELWSSEAAHLAYSTSALIYAVFNGDRNYGGHTPDVELPQCSGHLSTRCSRTNWPMSLLRSSFHKATRSNKA